MSDTGGLSKAAKKNKKKNERKKKSAGQATGSSGAKAEKKPRTVLDLLPIMKDELEQAKTDSDHKKASKIREQIWVLKDIIKGVKTDMPDCDLEPIIAGIMSRLNDQEKTESNNSESAGAAPAVDAEKRIRNLKKKLTSIEALKDRQAKGEKLEQSQLKKIENEDQVHDEIEELEKMLEKAMSDLGK